MLSLKGHTQVLWDRILEPGKLEDGGHGILFRLDGVHEGQWCHHWSTSEGGHLSHAR